MKSLPTFNLYQPIKLVYSDNQVAYKSQQVKTLKKLSDPIIIYRALISQVVILVFIIL